MLSKLRSALLDLAETKYGAPYVLMEGIIKSYPPDIRDKLFGMLDGYTICSDIIKHNMKYNQDIKYSKLCRLIKNSQSIRGEYEDQCTRIVDYNTGREESITEILTDMQTCVQYLESIKGVKGFYST